MQPAQLLQWYIDAGVDEAVADAPFNHFVAPVQRPGKAGAVILPASAAPADSARNVAPSAAMAEARALADAANTLDELVAAIKAFNGCALRKTATNTVIYDGNPASPLLLIGEAPGAEEDRMGIPFCGPSGMLLDKMLAAIGIDRTQCCITNTVYWRPPGNRQPSPEETAICQPFVQKFISLMNPALVLLVGGTATKAVLGTEQGITRLRGKPFIYRSPYREKDYPVAVTFHPSYLLRSPAQKRLAWQDMLAVKEMLS